MNRVKILLLALIFSVALNNIYAQIKSTIFINGKAFNTNQKLQQVEFNKIPVVSINPDFKAIDSIIQEEEKLDEMGVGRAYRFGYPILTDITMKDGIWITTEKHNIWSICIKSNGAYSLNFRLSDVNLSPNAEMYLFNPDGYIVYGPVFAKNVHLDMKGVF